MLRAGVLEMTSTMIYHDSHHLVHLFEDIHFMLFFVMLLFLFEAVVLVKSAMKASRPFRAAAACLRTPLRPMRVARLPRRIILSVADRGHLA